jgi:hypothetical protein
MDMKRARGVVMAALVPLSIGFFGLGGCGDGMTEEDEATVTSTDDLRRRWRPRPTPTPTPAPGGTAGQSGQQPGTVASGCDVCAEANACCNEVTNHGPLCTYDATYCATLDDVRRDAYINACKTLKTVTVQGWQSRGYQAPASCL